MGQSNFFSYKSLYQSGKKFGVVKNLVIQDTDRVDLHLFWAGQKRRKSLPEGNRF